MTSTIISHCISGILLTVFLSCPDLFAQSPARSGNLKFEHLNIEDGLSHITIRSVARDSMGFMWFATPDGLNRYDGYQFRTYRHDPLDSTSTPANSINTLYVDRDGTVWAGTFDGLIRYNPVSDNFITYQHDPQKPNSLPNNYIAAICEDHDGHLWVGTNKGLARLTVDSSGQTLFTNFRPALGNPYSLSHNNICAITRDLRPGSSDLWIGTRLGGVNRFDPHTGRAYPLYRPRRVNLLIRYSDEALAFLDRFGEQVQPAAALPSPGDSVQLGQGFELSEPTDAVIICQGEAWDTNRYDFGWLENGAGMRVWEFRPAEARYAGGHPKNRLAVVPLSLPPGPYRLGYQSDENHSAAAWNSGPPWRPRWWGIRIYLLPASRKNRLTTLLREEAISDMLPENLITALYADPVPAADGRYHLWVGTRDSGLVRIDLPPEAPTAESPYQDHQFLRVIDSRNSQWSLPPGRISNIYRSAGRAERSFIWVATIGWGLYRLDMQNPGEQFRRFYSRPANRYSLSSNQVHQVCEDHTGTLWIGTDFGINKLDHKKMQFKHYMADISEDDPAKQPGRGSVSCIFEDRSGFVWIGTYGGGLHRFDSRRETFMPYPPDNRKPHAAARTITAITERSGDPPGILWMTTNRRGLARFDISSGRFDYYPVNFQDTTALTAADQRVVCADRDGILWIGGSGGLHRLDPRENRFRRYIRTTAADSSRPDGRYLRSENIWAIIEDTAATEKTLWIGTVGGSLSKLLVGQSRFVHYDSDVYPQGVNNKTVVSLQQTRDGTIWAGTYSGGLARYNREKDTFTAYTVRDGLANNMVKGILEDRRGRLWLSTNGGLSCFDPASGKFTNYDVRDGLQSNLFNDRAFLKARDGKMFFGGINGFNCFRPDSLQLNTTPPPIVLTDFKKFDRSVRFDRPLNSVDQIELSYHENFFSFEFVALDYSNTLRNTYAYRLEGFDSDWVNCGTRRYASYTNLDPGEYRFRVKGANSDGIWNETGRAVKILIHPPFWKTGWFTALCIGTALLLIGLLHTYRLRTKLEQMRQIERVRQKAAADFHDELGHKLTKISLFTELIQRQLNGDSRNALDYVNRIGEISGGLYHGMRDFLWTLDPEKDSLLEVAIRLKDFGDEFFDNTGIAFHVEGLDESLKQATLSMDWKRHLVLLFKEAMHNILKHADCRNVTLSFSLNRQILKITLSDDGKGFRPAALNGAKGGNGIRNMSGRAEKLGGKLEIDSRNGHRGTAVRFVGELSTENS